MNVIATSLTRRIRAKMCSRAFQAGSMESGARRKLLAGALGFRQRKIVLAAGVVTQDKPLRDGCEGPSTAAKGKNAAAKKPPESGANPRLPEKHRPDSKRDCYAMLEEFYEALESSVALLRIRNQPCTFTAVSVAVESLTKRRFLHSHLAKIKHLFPEAIACDSYTWNDLDTLSLKTDIRIKLLPFTSDANGSKSVSGITRKWSADTMARRREFHKRIVAFEATHREEADIPEAPLFEEVVEAPEDEVDIHFDPKQSVLTGKVTIKSGYQDLVSRRLRSDDEISTSHFPPSFRPHFSRRRILPASATQPEHAAVPSVDATKVSQPVIGSEKMPALRTEAAVESETPAKVATEPETPVLRPKAANEPETPGHTQTCRGSSFSTPITPSEKLTPTLSSLFATPVSSSPSLPYSLIASVDAPKINPGDMPPKRQSVVKALQFGGQPIDNDVCSRVDNKLAFESVKRAESGSVKGASCVTSPSKRILSQPSDSPSKRSMLKSPATAPSTPLSLPDPEKRDMVREETALEPDQQFLIAHSAEILQRVRGKADKKLAFESVKQADCFASPSKRILSQPSDSPSKRSVLKSPGIAPSTPLNLPISEKRNPVDEETFSEPDQQILNSLSSELLHSVREKERKALEDKRSNLVQTKRRQQMIAGLPQFFNMTRLIFQSQSRSVMLHKDLLQQIVSSSIEVTDEDEIEERLRLLVELAPDWISSQASLTGEVMYRVQRSVEFPVIRRRLMNAS